MISNKQIRRILSKKYHKKIGKEGFKEISKIINKIIDNLLSSASRSAELFGRVVIKKQDFITEKK